MITIIHVHQKLAHAWNDQGKQVMGSGYFTGRQKPNYPVPAIRYEVEHYPDPLIEIVSLIDDRHCKFAVRFQEPMPWLLECGEYREVMPGMYYST